MDVRGQFASLLERMLTDIQAQYTMPKKPTMAQAYAAACAELGLHPITGEKVPKPRRK